VPEEPFPFLEGRLQALAAQVGEVVVVAPGAAAEALLAQLKAEKPLAVLALTAHPVLDPKEPEVLPLTKEEEALQPIVTGTLGKAYGSALAYVAKREAGTLEEERPQKAEVVEEEESEGEYTEIGEEEDYEDSFAEEDEDESEKSDADELSEDISAATTAAQTPKSSRRPMQDIDAMGAELAQKDKEEQLPKEVESFLPGYGSQAASDWASRQLRPLTPTEDRTPEADRYHMPGTPGKRPWHRLQPRTGQTHLWGENTLLADSQLRLEYKEPPLEDWGKGPENAAQASKIAPGSPVSFRVPLSPKDRVRASAALPHLSEPMKKGELTRIRQEQQVKVDDFTKSLMNATSNFDQCLDEAVTPPGSPSGRWRCGGRNADETLGFRQGRPDLTRPNLPQNLSSEFGGDAEDDVYAIKGCVARSNTPTKGSIPPPPHLEGATRASKKNGLKAWPVERSSSAGPAINRSMPETRYRLPRPRSSDARARKRFKGLLPEKPSKAAETAAQSCRRFLSRTCGTMQLALNTFDSTGDGKFNRWEWENGLKKLGYEAHYDIQEIFSILDKRKHHVLTLSDLLDHYNGLPITEGLPEPGLKGIASQIMHEAVIESLGPVITQALAQLLQKELLAPRGLPFTLPSMKGMKKKGDLSVKKQLSSRNPHQTLNLSGDESRLSNSPGSDRRKNRRTQFNMDQQSNLSNSQKVTSPQAKSPPGRRGKKNLTKFQVVGQLMRRKVRKGADFASSSSLERTTSSNKTITGTYNSTLSGPLGGSEKSLSGSPFNATSSRKKGMLGSTGMSSTSQAASSSGKPKHTRRSSRDRGGSRRNSATATPSRSPQPSRSPHLDVRKSSPKDPSRRKTSTASAASGPGHARDGAQRRPSSQPQRRAVRPENKYVGYNFIKDEAPSADSELGDWQREKLLPWMPRPTEDICRTYGHVFRLLNDPKTKQASQVSQKPQKKTVHVSVPRMPTVPPGRGGSSFGQPDSAGFDGSSDEDGPEGLGPLPSMKSGGKKMWGAKSSPDLLSSHLSTTAGTARPGSAGSQGSEDDPDRMRVSLPKLMRGASPIDTGMAR